MFFETMDFSLHNIAAYNLAWKKNVGNSGVRRYHSLSFRISGNAVFTSGECCMEASGGDLLFIPKGSQYYLNAESECLYVVHFNTDKPVLNKIKKMKTFQKQVYQQLFEEIVGAYSGKEPGYEHACKSILYKIIATMEQESIGHQAFQEKDDIENALEYIHQHYTNKQITIKDLVSNSFISETYFRRKFTQKCGCAPHDYISNLRINHAIELLETNYFSVAEVSNLCGFSSPYYFSSLLKKKTGHSPTYYMK
jgi:AraC-like DNA-binding protein